MLMMSNSANCQMSLCVVACISENTEVVEKMCSQLVQCGDRYVANCINVVISTKLLATTTRHPRTHDRYCHF